MKTLQEQIIEHVAKDELGKALDLLSNFLKDRDAELYAEATAHHATLAWSKKERRRGLISSADEDIKRANVRFAILENLLPALDASKADEGESGGKTTVRAGDPSPEKKPKSVFISYNHNDSATANKLKKALQAHGVAVIIDSEAMAAGEDIEDFIIQSIKESDITLSVVSKKSLLSGWVAMESINTLYSEKFGDGEKFIACYIDDDFFEDDFALGAAVIIDEDLEKLKQTIADHDKKDLGTKHLDRKKDRLRKLRNGLDDILVRLRGSLTLNIQEDQFDKSVARIINAITM